jgi:hypothetical protein
MSDFFNSNFPQGGYRATHKTNKDLNGHMTPNFEISEGMRFGQFYPAPYLPLGRFEPLFQDYFVITAGTPVSLDGNGWLVPAGFRKLLALGAGNGPQYTQLDVQHGLRNAAGALVTAGEYVIDSLISASVSVGRVMGVASYDVYALSGDDPTNPATYKFHNYNRQTGVAVLTDYLLEYPIEPFKRMSNQMDVELGADSATFDLEHANVVAHSIEVRVNGRRDVEFALGVGAGAGGVDQLDWSAIAADYLKDGDKVKVSYVYEITGTYDAPWQGIATFRGSAKPGDFVTINEESKFVAYAASAIGDTSAGDESASIAAAIDASLDIVGQIVLVDDKFPKQFLDRVKTAYDDRLTGPLVDGKTGETSKLDRMPGSATDGAPHNVYYAGGDTKTGIVRFNMNIK